MKSLALVGKVFDPVEFALIDMVDSGDNSIDFVGVAATPGEPNPMCISE